MAPHIEHDPSQQKLENPSERIFPFMNRQKLQRAVMCIAAPTARTPQEMLQAWPVRYAKAFSDYVDAHLTEAAAIDVEDIEAVTALWEQIQADIAIN